MVLNYIELSFILVSVITGWVLIPVFASLAGFPIGIASSAAGFKSCSITAVIKNYKAIVEKKM